MKNKSAVKVYKKVPKFIYTSVSCKTSATKDPCVRRSEDLKARQYSQCALGHWRCSSCGKSCKVERSKNG